MKSRRRQVLVAVLAMVVALISAAQLEMARSGIEIEQLEFGATPATLYTVTTEPESLVLVSHGFAGSRQMMEAISLTLARAGHAVVAFDYLGHGRNERTLSPEINDLTGTTEDLVQQTLDVAEQAVALVGPNRIALVGHSMATDVVIRAAARLPNVQSVAAISMYSDAVTKDHPGRLLIMSGAYETRLRAIALDTVGQIGERAENITVRTGEIERRAVPAPWAGHVGVLWSGVTSAEIAAWLGEPATPASTGPWIALLLTSIILLFWPLAACLPAAPFRPGPTLRTSAIASVLPAPVAALASLAGPSALGLAGFGALALCFATWGALALAVLRPALHLNRSGVWAGAFILAWGLLVFALALDRYAAAFVPTGPRLAVMLLLTPAMLIFALADRVMVQDHHFAIRFVLRIPFCAALLGAMVAQPSGIGMLFTTLPVLVLFLLVYGTIAGWAANRAGPVGPGLASGVILAWSLAASTPLFGA